MTVYLLYYIFLTFYFVFILSLSNNSTVFFHGVYDVNVERKLLQNSENHRQKVFNLYDSLPTIPPEPYEILSTWKDIQMPEKSYFAGFERPSNATKWKECLYRAARGDQLLLNRVIKTIKSPFDYVTADRKYRWIHRIADYKVSSKSGYLQEVNNFKGVKAPITLFGYKIFERENYEGKDTDMHFFNPTDVFDKNTHILRKMVVIGSMDENWGWASSYILNRTIPWGFGISGESNPYAKGYKYMQESLQPFLDNPNLVMLLVNQFNNITHPKVISYPLGVESPRDLWKSYHKYARLGVNKSHLLFSAGSNWAFRPEIRQCVRNNMGDLFIVKNRLQLEEFHYNLIGSYAVLCMPGLGYDTYRLWESLACGAMPIIERGVGLDRTVYKLPVLLVDDFYDLNPFMIRQAYVEALYWANEWEYERMTHKHWEHMLFEASETVSDEVLQKYHPMTAVDTGFTRPLVPFDCEAIGGCGTGTKRVPKKSCAIDPSVMTSTYKWSWDHSINDNK